LAPIAVLGALSIWALPDARAPAGPIEPLYFAFFAALFMWPNYLAFSFPGLPWITLTRLIALPLAVVTLASVSMSASFRSGFANLRGPASPVCKMLIVLIAIEFITLPLSQYVRFSIVRFINAQFDWTLMFFVSCYVFGKPGRALLWVYLLLGITLFLCLIGILENRVGHVLWLGHIPSFLKISAPDVRATLAGGFRNGRYRVQAIFSTSLEFSQYLALASPFVLHLATASSRVWLRAVAAATLSLLVYVTLVTGARLGVIGIFIAFLAYLLLWAMLKWRREKTSLVGPAVALAYPAIFALAVAATFVSHRLGAIVWGNGPQDASNAGRQEEWHLAGPKILSNPFGHGIGTGAAVVNYHQPDGLLTIDSYYLSTILEFGVIGFLMYYGSILYSIYLCARGLERAEDKEDYLLIPLASSLAAFMFTSSVLSETETHPIVFMLLGMTAALVYRRSGAASRRDPATGTSSPGRLLMPTRRG
jgi:O-antigen ligase